MTFKRIEVGRGTGECVLCHGRAREFLLDARGKYESLFLERGLTPTVPMAICDRCAMLLQHASIPAMVAMIGDDVGAALDFVLGPISWTGVDMAITEVALGRLEEVAR